MSAPRSLILERFRRLPRRASDVWQGGMVRARTWIEEPDSSVRRPWAAVWVSLATGMMNVQLSEHGDPTDASLALQTLTDLGLKFMRTRPARLEVGDSTLGAHLAEALADPELSVDLRADLPAVRRVVREMGAMAAPCSSSAAKATVGRRASACAWRSDPTATCRST
jgi:hypothetical protein